MLGYASRAPVGSRTTSTFEAYDTRAGGLPAYFEKTQERPLCRCCGQPLYLVAQVYAPTDRDRSLLIFGCNSVPCNGFGADSPSLRTPGALWSVQRTQSAQAYAAAPEYVPAVEAPLTAAVVPTPETDSWGAVGAWGDAPFEGAVVLQPPSSSSVATSGYVASSTVYAPASAADRCRFPAYTIKTTLEEGSDHEGEDSAEDSDSEGESRDRLGGSSTADAEAQQWRSYKQWLAATGEEAEAEGSHREFDEGTEAERHEKEEDSAEEEAHNEGDGSWLGVPASVGGRKSAAQQHPKVSRHKGVARKAPDAVADGADAYEAVPVGTRYMLRWQAWLRRAEHPCIRYAYGEQPRWPVPPAEVLGGPGGEVPPCPCGRPRVFELQLLPAILTLLDVDEHTGSAAGAATSSERAAVIPASDQSAKKSQGAGSKDRGRRGHGGGAPDSAGAAKAIDTHGRFLPGGGMDFATVLIFSCPESCDASTSEIAVVVPNR